MSHYFKDFGVLSVIVITILFNILLVIDENAVIRNLPHLALKAEWERKIKTAHKVRQVKLCCEAILNNVQESRLIERQP